jgi:hypothetical protein
LEAIAIDSGDELSQTADWFIDDAAGDDAIETLEVGIDV